MYSIYNVETLEKVINTVHNIHNMTSSHERLFEGQHSSSTFRLLYAHSLSLHHYSINSLLYLRTMQDKYIALYRELISQLCIYASPIRVLAKGYLPNTLVAPSKLRGIIHEVRKTLQVTNPDYDLVIDRLHLYYDMQLVTFGTDKDKNLIVQFQVFVQPYTQQPLILLSTGNNTHSYFRQKWQSIFIHTFTGWKSLHCIKLRNIPFAAATGTKDMQGNWLWILLWGTICSETQD